MNIVIFDGECPVCISLKGFIEARSACGELDFIPFQSEVLGEAAPGLSQEEASRALVVVAANGKRLRGARAVCEALRQLPGAWGVIGKILGLPPFIWLAEPSYRLFARHRHGVGRFLRG